MPERIQFPLLLKAPPTGHFGPKELAASSRRGVVPAGLLRTNALVQGLGRRLIGVLFPRGLEDSGEEMHTPEKMFPEGDETRAGPSLPQH